MLEFGPDSGENALVFATWGARCTLVEPNLQAHATIRSYFEQFGLQHALRDLRSSDVLGYVDTEHYDIIVAEGFIYTVRPTSAWLEVFRRLLRPGGHFLVTYYGGFVEWTLGAVHHMHRRGTGQGSLESARALYAAKWESIPHTRHFNSWVMDVLENPFVRASSSIDPSAFIDELDAAGFDLAAAYPRYDDALAMDWHKRAVPRGERIARAKRHIARSALSFLVGRKLHLADVDTSAEVCAIADRLMVDVERLRAHDDGDAAERAIGGFRRLAAITSKAALVCDDDDRERAVEQLSACAQALALAASGEFAALRAFTSTDAALIAAWGLPTHIVAGRLRTGSG